MKVYCSQNRCVMVFNPKIVLASASPRRKQLLSEAGFVFEIRVKNVNEDFDPILAPEQVPVWLAKKKALAFESDDISENEILITADTVVILDGKVLNKPADKAEAVEMLGSLSGRKHTVVTGVCLRFGNQLEVFSDSTHVYFKNLEPEEINWYIDNCQPFDKAGAYGAQDWMGMIGIERLEGSFYTVMGLPIHQVYAAIKKIMQP